MPRSKAYSKDVVLERAMHVFWINGYDATSVRLLEKEMGINQFSIYASFKDKRSLFIKSIRKYREFVKQHVFSDLLQENSGLAELESFLFKITALNKISKKEKGCLIVNTAAEIGNKDDYIAREVNLYYDFIRDMLRKVLLNAITKNEIPANTNVEQQANFFLGIMQGISVASKTMDKNKLSDFISVALAQIC